MKTIRIPASPQNPNPRRRFSQEVSVILGDDLEGSFSASEKDFPANLPQDWVDPDDGQRKSVTWLSNFGITTTTGTPVTSIPSGKKYTIELARVSGKLVYFDGSIVKKLNTRSVGGNRIQADLTEADPPIGIG